MALWTKEGNPAAISLSGLWNVWFGVDLGCQFFCLAVRSKNAEYREVMLGLTSVEQKLVMEMGCLVTFILIFDVDGEIFPVGLDFVFSKGIREIGFS